MGISVLIAYFIVLSGLTRNAFVGNLPSTIGQLKSLIWLDVSSNRLNGSLPQSSDTGAGLDNLTKAQHL